MQPQRDQVFICYSRTDDHWRQRIQTALTPLLRGGAVRAWDDTRIVAGSDWLAEIDEALGRARVGLVLASPDALASDFIMERELPALESASQSGDLRLLWVPVRACLWDHTPLAHYQAAVRDPRSPLAAMSASAQEGAIVAVCRQIERAFGSPAPIPAPPQTPGGTGPTGTAGCLPSVASIVQGGNERRLVALREEYAAAVTQLGETIDAVQRLRIERRIASLESEMRGLAT